MALGTSRELPLVYSWSLPEVGQMPNVKTMTYPQSFGPRRNKPVSLSWLLPEVSQMPNVKTMTYPQSFGPRGTSQFLFPDYCPKWVKRPMSRQWLNLSPLDRGGKSKVFPRLTLSPNETLIIPLNHHVTWKFPFSSGVPIGYYLRDCLVIGWF